MAVSSSTVSFWWEEFPLLEALSKAPLMSHSLTHIDKGPPIVDQTPGLGDKISMIVVEVNHNIHCTWFEEGS